MPSLADILPTRDSGTARDKVALPGRTAAPNCSGTYTFTGRVTCTSLRLMPTCMVTLASWGAASTPSGKG